jgi:hypothetical protein
MKYKAKKGYGELPNDKNFIALGSSSDHLKLVAGLIVDINTDVLPISKELGDCLTEIKSKSKGEK